MQAFGAGGPMVRTELSVGTCQPGGRLQGEVELTGGDHQVKAGYVALVLLTSLRTGGVQEFYRCRVTENFTLSAGQRLVLPFSCEVPWEAPLSMPGVELSLRTELEIAREVDRSDLDPIEITPTLAQQRILRAVQELGFQFARSHVERGLLPGLPQTLPLYQEIEFAPGNTYSQNVNQLEVTFVGTEDKLHVVLECDRRVGPLADRDVFGRFVVDPSNISDTDWQGLLSDWLIQLGKRRAL